MSVNPHCAAQPIRFLLNGEPRAVSDIDPHTSLLDYLREHEGLTGTKEGCAEGDCGACTVGLLEAQDGRVQVRPVNSCIRFLPTVQGKGVVTVEGLGNSTRGLHPVQQAMADCHGSQCGFCTPGFVMSLFALFKNHAAPDRQAVCDALAGNLCRCTGYRPIIDAGQAMYALGGAAPQDSSLRSWLCAPATCSQPCTGAESSLAGALQALQGAGSWRYEAAGVQFFAPRTLDELSALVNEHPQGWILAGGTDVGLWVNKALQDVAVFISTGDVPALHRIEATATHLEIGAAVTLDHAAAAIHQHWPAFDEVWRRFASPPVRASGTLGGNVANGSPIGDSMPVLIALGAQVLLRQGQTQRVLPLESLYLDYKRQARMPGEWVEAVQIPWTPDTHRLAAYKLSKRPDQDISAVLAAFNISVTPEDVIASARIAFGGMAGVPKRALHAESALIGQRFEPATFECAAQAIAADFAPINDMRASAAYRSEAAAQLLLRFWDEQHAAPAAARVL